MTYLGTFSYLVSLLFSLPQGSADKSYPNQVKNQGPNDIRPTVKVKQQSRYDFRNKVNSDSHQFMRDQANNSTLGSRSR